MLLSLSGRGLPTSRTPNLQVLAWEGGGEMRPPRNAPYQRCAYPPSCRPDACFALDATWHTCNVAHANRPNTPVCRMPLSTVRWPMYPEAPGTSLPELGPESGLHSCMDQTAKPLPTRNPRATRPAPGPSEHRRSNHGGGRGGASARGLLRPGPGVGLAWGGVGRGGTPEGTWARKVPMSVVRSTSTVGLPRESRTCHARAPFRGLHHLSRGFDRMMGSKQDPGDFGGGGDRGTRRDEADGSRFTWSVCVELATGEGQHSEIYVSSCEPG